MPDVKSFYLRYWFGPGNACACACFTHGASVHVQKLMRMRRASMMTFG